MKIAIVDSGIHPNHPHVGKVAGGVAIAGDDLTDRLGHGTAVAGAIRERNPEAELYAVKIFDRRLSTTHATLLKALNWCEENAMDLINLSVGTNKPLPLTTALIVSPMGPIAVQPDPSCATTPIITATESSTPPPTHAQFPVFPPSATFKAPASPLPT